MRALRYPLIVLLIMLSPLTLAKKNPLQRADVQAFIQRMVAQHGFDRKTLNSLFANVHINPVIVAKRKNRAEKTQPWYVYKSYFINQARITAGVAFWRAHDDVIQHIAEKSGIPPALLVAIVGVETNYGRHVSRYRVIDALSSLAFGDVPRSPYFKRELEQFLLLVREQKLDPYTVYGSYAGAMGQPQFMPASYRKYAVSYASKGFPDLNNNIDDIMASIANFLIQHGWDKHQAIAVQASQPTVKKLSLQTSTQPRYSLTELAKLGIKPLSQATQLAPQKLVLIYYLDNKTGTELWLGTKNFYVLTRYNPSKQYAMAVYELSQAINEAYQDAQRKE